MEFESERWKTSYHEAGHAVAFAMQGCECQCMLTGDNHGFTIPITSPANRLMKGIIAGNYLAGIAGEHCFLSTILTQTVSTLASGISQRPDLANDAAGIREAIAQGKDDAHLALNTVARLLTSNSFLENVLTVAEVLHEFGGAHLIPVGRVVRVIPMEPLTQEIEGRILIADGPYDHDGHQKRVNDPLVIVEVQIGKLSPFRMDLIEKPA